MKNSYEYMIALPKSNITDSVKAMVDIILLDALREIDEAYNEGKSDGENSNARWDEAYEEGYSDGHREGFADGKAEKE
jgi:flagellar biosynthesis/type III secretory pathway protein FliH